MGASALLSDDFAEAVSWQKGGAALIGQDAIFKAAKQTGPTFALTKSSPMAKPPPCQGKFDAWGNLRLCSVT